MSETASGKSRGEHAVRRSFLNPSIVPSHTTVFGVEPQTGQRKLFSKSRSSNRAKEFQACHKIAILTPCVKLCDVCDRRLALKYAARGF